MCLNTRQRRDVDTLCSQYCTWQKRGRNCAAVETRHRGTASRSRDATETHRVVFASRVRGRNTTKMCGRRVSWLASRTMFEHNRAFAESNINAQTVSPASGIPQDNERTRENRPERTKYDGSMYRKRSSMDKSRTFIAQNQLHAEANWNGDTERRVRICVSTQISVKGW